MGWSRSARIKTLLAIDSTFFFIEIIVGYTVGSLALVADSFHMLNDVCSLVVALYAIKFAQRKPSSENFSYGWQRAEVLGALINGVFLLALCFSIFMEAIERLFKSSEVTNPRLVVVVGAFGLASNIVGLFLFHDHSHGPGGHSHGHGHSHEPEAVAPSPNAAPPRHKNGDPVPVPNGSSERAPLLSSSAQQGKGRPASWHDGDSDDDEEESDPIDQIFVHPAQARDNVIRAAEKAGYGANQAGGRRQSLAGGSGRERALSAGATATEPPSKVQSFGGAISDARRRGSAPATAASKPQVGHNHLHDEDGHHEGEHGHGEEHDHDHDHDHDHGHDHASHSHGHSHSHGGGGGSMNMRGVFLHVLGDALGNVGVIAAGLVIWLTTWSGRFYFDPIISLVITVIIFSSALPLVKSASFILLQGTPQHLSVLRVREAILAVPGVISVHELHIWSLSESKLVASVHVCVAHQDDYAEISRRMRRELHRFGVHSSTIQPEFISDPETVAAAVGGDLRKVPSFHAVAAAAEAEALGCLVRCDVNCGEESCCPPGPTGDLEEGGRGHEES